MILYNWLKEQIKGRIIIILFILAFMYTVWTGGSNNISLADVPQNESPVVVEKIIYKEKIVETNKKILHKSLYDSIYTYIKNNSKNKNDKYVHSLTRAYVKLINERKENKHLVLYMIAIGCVESNFDIKSISSCGAIGITQVMYNIHKEKFEKYGITYNSIRTNPYHSIKAGLIVFENYWINNDYSYIKACYRYLGSNNIYYVNKVNSCFTDLQMKLMNLLLKA